MLHIISIVALALCLPLSATAHLMVPMVDLRNPGGTPLLSTWAHAGGKTALQIEAPSALELYCEIYQVDGQSVIVLAREVTLVALKPGANLLEIQLPEKSERGKLLFKIASTRDGKPVVNAMVDILPKDAWQSLSKLANDGKVSIDPSLKIFQSWATSNHIPASSPKVGHPTEYYFGKPDGILGSPPPARYVIFERDAPDAFLSSR